MRGTQPFVVMPLPDTTAEQARATRARVWAYVFDCHANRKTVEPAPEADGRNDGKAKGDSADVSILPQ